MKNDKTNPLLPIMVEGAISNRWTDISPRPDPDVWAVPFPHLHYPYICGKPDFKNFPKLSWGDMSPIPDPSEWETSFPFEHYERYHGETGISIITEKPQTYAFPYCIHTDKYY